MKVKSSAAIVDKGVVLQQPLSSGFISEEFVKYNIENEPKSFELNISGRLTEYFLNPSFEDVPIYMLDLVFSPSLQLDIVMGIRNYAPSVNKRYMITPNFRRFLEAVLEKKSYGVLYLLDYGRDNSATNRQIKKNILEEYKKRINQNVNIYLPSVTYLKRTLATIGSELMYGSVFRGSSNGAKQYLTNSLFLAVNKNPGFDVYACMCVKSGRLVEARALILSNRQLPADMLTFYCRDISSKGLNKSIKALEEKCIKAGIKVVKDIEIIDSMYVNTFKLKQKSIVEKLEWGKLVLNSVLDNKRIQFDFV